MPKSHKQIYLFKEPHHTGGDAIIFISEQQILDYLELCYSEIPKGVEYTKIKDKKILIQKFLDFYDAHPKEEVEKIIPMIQSGELYKTQH